MYIAHLETGYVIKRMPDTGASHGPGCDSCTKRLRGCLDVARLMDRRSSRPMKDLSTSSWLFLCATTIRLKWRTSPLRRLLRRLRARALHCEDCSTTYGMNLGFSHWQPEMQGKRSWFAVRTALVEAIESKETKSASLKDILYIPEVYDRSEEH